MEVDTDLRPPQVDKDGSAEVSPGGPRRFRWVVDLPGSQIIHDA
jgi:hypothetical protein